MKHATYVVSADARRDGHGKVSVLGAGSLTEPQIQKELFS